MGASGRLFSCLTAAVLLSGCEDLPAQRVLPPPHVPAPPPPPDGALENAAKAAVAEWREAHDERDKKRLEALYASRVRFQGFDLTREVVLRFAEAESTRSPSMRREVSGTTLDLRQRGLVVAHFATTKRAMNRITTETTTLGLSCDLRGARDCDGVPCEAHDLPRCVVVTEDSSAYGETFARARALSARPGSCPEAILDVATSTDDAKAIVGARPPRLAGAVVSMPPERPRATVVLFDESPEGAPRAVYDVELGTFTVTEVLPGDVVQKPDPATVERAKRACASR